MNNEEISANCYISNIEQSAFSNDTFKLGDIVALKSHPYQTNYFEPKIGAYARFTPPLMIVIEILNKTTHDTFTGVKDSNQYKCLFYSTKEGKFEKLWFKSEELKYIGNYVKEDHGISSFDITDWKKELLGKEVVLQTVDLELGKKKTFLDTVDGRSKMKVSNLLDYLPPVASIMDVKYEDDHTKHNDKGKVTSKKHQLHAKLKWLNNESGKFSEEAVPLECLKLVKFNENPVIYNEKKTYLLSLKVPKQLEDNTDVYMKSIPVLLTSTTFNHYYYVYDGMNVFTNKSRSYSHTFPVRSYVDLKKMLRSGKDLGDKSNIQKYLSEENKTDVKDKWFKISYIDSNGVSTERIVYVQDFVPKPEAIPEDESKSTLKCNCLLRGGDVRHFLVERIQKCIALPKEFEGIFFERVKPITTAKQ
ncbi:hypothetical protein [Sphingobacterium haloxyli]|uniref:Uncharacterized protein n=1 Tax=Sphingobacterium haloxyli TaxID=2100533 RepID=A0A2S9J6Z9_9SPHI|nr:hypothetical protein [Sphingobacterium haloxyli]PRD48527.1 hypothetical protein C5745_04820 [Sphingobacterium haloxyli]